MADTTRLPQPLESHWDWQRRAACRNLPESLFFHPDGERDPSRGQRVDQAKAVCAICPVRERCLAHSLEVQERYGTWGGVDERERFAILHHPPATDGNPGRRSAPPGTATQDAQPQTRGA